MAKSRAVLPRKRGRPATGRGPDKRDPVTSLRLSPKLRAEIDAWAAEEDDKPPRSEAIRRLVEQALGAKAQPMPQQSPKSALKASDMAAQQIDKMADSSATNEERHARKRRLLKGPGEFRDIRSDHPKPKR